MRRKLFVILLLTVQGVYSDIMNDEDFYIDRLVFNSDSVEDIKLDEDNDGYNFTYNNGVWMCGSCDVLDETKVIYTDELNIDTNAVNDQDFNVGFQMALALSDMECVAVEAAVDNTVRRVSGSCLGPTITIDIAKAGVVKVNVYGKD